MYHNKGLTQQLGAFRGCGGAGAAAPQAAEAVVVAPKLKFAFELDLGQGDARIRLQQPCEGRSEYVGASFEEVLNLILKYCRRTTDTHQVGTVANEQISKQQELSTCRTELAKAKSVLAAGAAALRLCQGPAADVLDVAKTMEEASK